jgi:hypothetical protein
MSKLNIPRNASEFYLQVMSLFIAAFLGGMASCSINKNCEFRALSDIWPLIFIIAFIALILYVGVVALSKLLPK